MYDYCHSCGTLTTTVTVKNDDEISKNELALLELCIDCLPADFEREEIRLNKPLEQLSSSVISSSELILWRCSSCDLWYQYFMIDEKSGQCRTCKEDA